ncbi:PQQ-binding-like beta-propeller repeat protein [Acidovorax sp. Leaf78]|uniref:outer membrane protein assembly factor BamB family protein n=1 Tax=Acidovorax sp. Leaf78 TaxID=1736237 RepID=UPI0009EBE8FA|nr:PQQ-binding-like beta-propeller repeat protein [Acidovorax sp. Leaf78]
MNKFVLMLAVLLSACGGGGGGHDAPSTPAPAPAPAPAPEPVPPTSPAPAENTGSIALTPSVLDVSTVEGESQNVTLTVKLAKPVSGAVFVDLSLPPPFESRGTTEKIDALTYSRTLTTFSNLSAGTKSGLLTVSIVVCPNGCGDAQVIHESKHPYRVEVLPAQPNLTPLQRLDGAGAWSSRYGNGANSSYVPTTVKLNPASFKLRWKTADTRFISSPLTANGYIIAHTGSKLEALREHDGARIWSINSNPTSADEPVILKNKVFTPEYLGFDSAITGYEISTGQKSLSILGSSSKLRTDGESLYFDYLKTIAGQTFYQLTRTDSATGAAGWQIQHDLFRADRRVAIDDQYAYAYMFNKLRVFRKSDGVEAFSLDHELGDNATSRPLTAMVDSSQRIIGGWYSLSHAYLTSFSIVTKKQMWSVKDGFRSLPSLAHNMLYTVATQTNSAERPSLQARSGDTGAVIWSVLLPDTVNSNQNVMYEVITVGDIIFISSNRLVGGATYAVDRNTRQIVWTYPVTGRMGISENGSLLIQSSSGNLLAFNLR